MTPDPYYTLARTLQKMDRQTLAVNLRNIHQQAVGDAIERAAQRAREHGQDALAEEILHIRVNGRQLADDRTHLQRAEAILAEVLKWQERKYGDVPYLSVDEQAVSKRYDAGDGVDVIKEGTRLVVTAQPGKFAGK